MSLQTLTALPDATSPPTQAEQIVMAADMAVLENLDFSDLAAFSIVALTYLINDGGGKDYRSLHPLLISEALTMFNGITILDDGPPNKNVALIETVILWGSAYDADNTIGLDVGTILDAAKDLRVLPYQNLTVIRLFLSWMLGV